MKNGKPRVLFLMPTSVNFSGQMGAAFLLRDLFAGVGIRTRVVGIPSFERRDGWRVFRLAAHGLKYALAALKIPFLASGCSRMYLTPGQTNVGILRDAWLFLMARLFVPRAAIAIHGSLFMEWQNDRGLRWIFLWMLRRAEAVTVLGLGQFEKLRDLGIPAQKLVIVPNAVAITPIPEEALAAKHQAEGPVRVLYLSLLVDSKGYPEYLEALRELSQRPAGRKIEAVLCGPLVGNALSSRFQSVREAREWIVGICDEINRSPAVSIRWIEGARGEAKLSLLRQAHLFVLPSRYRNEAQPLSIIEAMASGAAVISTTVGEIPYSFKGHAVLLDDPSAHPLADAIEALAADATGRQTLAQGALEHFHQTYVREKYLAKWLDILGLKAD